MNNIEAQALLQKYEKGECTAQEMILLESWFIKLKSEQRTHQLSEKVIEQDLSEVWLALKEKNFQDRKVWLWSQPVPNFFRKIAVFAAALAAITLGVWMYRVTDERKDSSTLAYHNDIAPGKNTATLTLANGKKIRLTDAVNGELANEAGVVITKSVDGQLIYEIVAPSASSGNQENKINTLSTANGETYMLILPDKSKVWMNAASSLTYAAGLLENGKRIVTLTGEGYFEIAKDKAHPFVVKTRSQSVEVLGTHFNINSYSNEPVVSTSLIKGSVKIASGNIQQILKPGEQAINTGSAITIRETNMENITDWKNGDFYLDGVDFRIAMRKIARWFDVEVVYDSSVPDNIRSGGWISRSNKLVAVLKSIESSGLVRFKVEGKKIVVFK